MKFGSQLKTYGRVPPLSVYYRDGKKEIAVGGRADIGKQIPSHGTISGISLTLFDDELNLNSVKMITFTSSEGDTFSDESPLPNKNIDYTYINHVHHHESQGGNLHGTTQSASRSAPGS